MAYYYVGEIKMFAGNFAPSGWNFCDGSLQSIANNTTLYALIGTTYGGDGVNTFALPDLRGRIPLGVSSAYPLATSGGTETVVLTPAQLPGHSHQAFASSTGGSDSPSGNYWGASPSGKPYSPSPGSLTLNAAALGNAGGNQAHNNLIPYVTVSYIIALYGIYPT